MFKYKEVKVEYGENMKKLFAIAFVVMLLALPLVNAGHEGHENPMEMEKPEPVVVKPSDITKTETTSEDASESSAYAKEMVKEAKEMREKWKEVREKWKETMEEYRSARQEWVSAREAWMNTKESGASETVVVEKAKTFLDRGIELAIKHLEVVKERIENDPNLSEEEKQKILDKIDSYIEWLSNKKEELPELESKEQLREKATEVKEEWKSVKGDVKEIVGKLASARIENALEKAEKAGKRVEAVIEKYKEEGYDTTEAEELLQKFWDKLDDAKVKYEEVKQKWDEVETVQDANELVKEINQYIRESAADLKEGYKNLKESIKELKQLKQEG